MTRARLAAAAAVAVALAAAAVAAVWSQRAAVTPDGAAGPPPATVWLGDFESEDEGRAWSRSGLEATLAAEHASHGRQSLRLDFPADGEPRLRLRPRLGHGRAWGDWRRFGVLRFELHNPGARQARLLLGLRDGDGVRYEERFYLAPRSGETVAVPLAELAAYLDTAAITEITFYRWREREPAVFFLDAVRLEGTPPRSQPEAAGARPGERWQALWTTSLTKLFRDPAGLRGRPGPVLLDLARGESESVQVALVGAAGRGARVTAEVGPLLRGEEGGGRIGPDAIAVREVGYVHTERPYYPVPHVGDWPDPLPEARAVSVEAGQVQPLWLTLTAPRDARAGHYRGQLRLRGDDGSTVTLLVEARVRDFSLPEAPALATAFELVRGRLRKAYQRLPGGDRVGERLPGLERRYSLALLEHRIFPLVNLDPTQDAALADLAAYQEHGLTAFAVGSWGGHDDNAWPPGEMAGRLAWYRDAAAALARRGLLARAYLYAWDEPPPGLEATARVLGELRAAAPGLRRMVALHELPDADRYQAWLADADVLALRNAAFDPALAAAWRRRGKELWLYASGPAHPHATLVLDYPAMAHRILPWLCWKYELKGLLYWSVNHWTEDPWREPMNFRGQNGSGVLFYPGADGPVPSLRLEVLRDGIDDYDYLEILRRRLEAMRRSGAGDPALLAAGAALLRVDPPLIESMRRFTSDPELLLAHRRAVADLIEQLPAD